MTEDEPPPEFMSALGTEYFVPQSTASSTISESAVDFIGRSARKSVSQLSTQA